jgi:hypothetical protein
MSSTIVSLHPTCCNLPRVIIVIVIIVIASDVAVLDISMFLDFKKAGSMGRK